VRGRPFDLVKIRYLGGATYRSADGELYLRVGDRAAVRREYALGRALQDQGVAVPAVLAHGDLAGDRAYVIERSVGAGSFGERFAAETRRHGTVDDGTFAAFLETTAAYVAIQCRHPLSFGAAAPDGLDAVVRWSHARAEHGRELPDDRLTVAYRTAGDRLSDRPWCLSLFDLNPFNVLPGCLIDLEIGGPAPFGYDALTSVHFGHFWPPDRIAYVLTPAQIGQYERRLDDVARAAGWPPPTAARNEFLLLKAVWASARDAYGTSSPQAPTDLWAWRVEVRDRCAARYLAGQSLDPAAFHAIKA